jgi:CRISPR-associated protein Csd1
MIGTSSNDNEVPLLPICHTTQKAQIEIVIDQNGNFKRARVVPKDEARTIIPCTEGSGGRTSGEAPHPLCDKLQYVAEDYSKYGGDKAYYFNSFRKGLEKWCESKHSHPKAEAVLKYIEKGNVIKDLVNNQILFTGNDGLLLEKWDNKVGEDVPDIFKVSANSGQMDAFVRWIVEIPTDPQSAVWTDPSLFICWIEYYLLTKKSNKLCYVTGTELPVAEQHPRNIRRPGDGAKLISSGKTKNKNGKEKVDDPTGFTFLGRFSKAEQACGVSLMASHKAHYALSWLIDRQGYKRGDQAIVAWATTGMEIPDPLADSFSMLDLNIMQSDSEASASTAQELALKLSKKIAGYSANLGVTTDVVVMGLNSATPGRMAIFLYRELTGSDFLKRIENWHETCCWIHDYRSKEVIDVQTGKRKKVNVRFVGAPAPGDIAEAAFGSKVDEKLRNATVERILPCIIDGQKLPRDLVEVVVRRASNRVGMEVWEWKKTLSIACALYRKSHEMEEFDMALDESRKTRDYLYGRLLALAESLEEWALNKAGEDRPTTAARLMHRFADHPYSTWRTIELALGPYKTKLGGKSLKRQRLISEVIALFAPDDFTSDKKLSGEFLLGYHCQREALWKKKEEEQDDN